MRRDATKVIWRTVVFAGAMLGAPACSKKHPQTTPQNTAKPTEPATQSTTTPETTPAQGTTPQSGEDPCAGRIRGADDDGGGGTGRGFVLS